MQFIDINCMIGEWGYKKLRFKTAAELNLEMERLKIEKAFVFDSRAWLYDPNKGNEMLIQSINGYSNLIPVYVLTSLIDQEFGGKDRISALLKENNVGAVRLFPLDHTYTLNSWNIDKLYSIADEASIPIMLDCREDGGTLDNYFSMIYNIASTYVNTPIILLTIGYRNLRILYDLFEKCPNIFVDTSTFITYRGIEDVVKNFGSERILFGTRMPFIDGGVSVGRLIYAEIDQKDKENIAYRNILGMMKKNKLYNGKADRGCDL